jgi:hypothetical protein
MADEHLSKEDVKEALKEAHKEWLNDHFAAFGRWTFMAFMGLLFAAFIQFLVWLRSPSSGGVNAERSQQTSVEGSR